jgi:hypothetical protein
VPSSSALAVVRRAKDPVQGGLGVDTGLVAHHGERGVGDVEAKVLAHLVLPQHLPDP